ncbi:hypothetical protein CHT97_04645 [Lacticaseibacillus chiayiensis]|nr:hypothetical protein CHT97_04645 [Lacticaseibacillus chiayiensis]
MLGLLNGVVFRTDLSSAFRCFFNVEKTCVVFGKGFIIVVFLLFPVQVAQPLIKYRSFGSSQ